MMKKIVLTLILFYSALLSAQQRITLLFVGDLMQHQAQIDAARTTNGNYDYSDCFALVKEEIQAADIAIGNLEVTLGGKPYRGYPAFSAPDEYLYAICDAGFDILLTANNHCLDRGKKGLERTITLLDSLNIPYAGTYRNDMERRQRYPLLIEKNGFRLVLLNYTYGTNGLKPTSPNVVNYIEKEQMQEDIRQARSYRPDAIIACMHWGMEYKSLPNTEQRQLADWLLAQGVTHIIGSHPHVIQPMELRENGCQRNVVVYSLGNFISNMSAPNTDGGLIFTMELEKYPLISPIPAQLTEHNHSILQKYEYPLSIGCTLSQCNYSLVWTARPNLSGEKNFKLYPANSSTESLPTQARNKQNIFMKAARKLLQQYNIGIEEKKQK